MFIISLLFKLSALLLLLAIVFVVVLVVAIKNALFKPFSGNETMRDSPKEHDIHIIEGEYKVLDESNRE